MIWGPSRGEGARWIAAVVCDSWRQGSWLAVIVMVMALAALAEWLRVSGNPLPIDGHACGHCLCEQDCNFHECAKLDEFESLRQLSFTPPDGEFVLLNYRINAEFRCPFRLFPSVCDIDPYRWVLCLWRPLWGLLRPRLLIGGELRRSFSPESPLATQAARDGVGYP